MDESFPDGSHLVDTLNAQTKAGSRGDQGGSDQGRVSLAQPGPAFSAHQGGVEGTPQGPARFVPWVTWC